MATNDGRLDEEGRRLLAGIVDGVDRMRTLINDLLEYSRLSEEPPERRPVDCNDLLEETLHLLEDSIAEKGRHSYTRERCQSSKRTAAGLVRSSRTSSRMRSSSRATSRPRRFTSPRNAERRVALLQSKTMVSGSTPSRQRRISSSSAGFTPAMLTRVPASDSRSAGASSPVTGGVSGSSPLPGGEASSVHHSRQLP